MSRALPVSQGIRRRIRVPRATHPIDHRHPANAATPVGPPGSRLASVRSHHADSNTTRAPRRRANSDFNTTRAPGRRANSDFNTTRAPQRHSRGSGNPPARRIRSGLIAIPAIAGASPRAITVAYDVYFTHHVIDSRCWIPAFAGMTVWGGPGHLVSKFCAHVAWKASAIAARWWIPPTARRSQDNAGTRVFNANGVAPYSPALPTGGRLPWVHAAPRPTLKGLCPDRRP